jgi:hypothetical protein
MKCSDSGSGMEKCSDPDGGSGTKHLGSATLHGGMILRLGDNMG